MIAGVGRLLLEDTEAGSGEEIVPLSNGKPVDFIDIYKQAWEQGK